MTPDQIDKIQASFAKVAPIAPAAAALFYDRLFTMAPEVKPLFKGDIGEQGRKLMATLGAVVNGLKTLDVVAPVAQAWRCATSHMASSQSTTPRLAPR